MLLLEEKTNEFDGTKYAASRLPESGPDVHKAPCLIILPNAPPALLHVPNTEQCRGLSSALSTCPSIPSCVSVEPLACVRSCEIWSCCITILSLRVVGVPGAVWQPMAGGHGPRDSLIAGPLQPRPHPVPRLSCLFLSFSDMAKVRIHTYVHVFTASCCLSLPASVHLQFVIASTAMPSLVASEFLGNCSIGCRQQRPPRPWQRTVGWLIQVPPECTTQQRQVQTRQDKKKKKER